MLSEVLNSKSAVVAGGVADIKGKSYITFLEIKDDNSLNYPEALNNCFGIDNMKIELSTNEVFKVKFYAEEFTRYELEIRLSHRYAAMGRCSCSKGLENIRCEHLLKILKVYGVLKKLSLAKRITKRSDYLWIPYDLQKT